MTVATALRETERGGEKTIEAELYKVKGELLLMRDPPDEAEAERCFRTAIDIARRQGGEGLRTARDDRSPPDDLRDLRLVAKASTPSANRLSMLRPIKQLDDRRYRIWRSPVSDAF